MGVMFDALGLVEDWEKAGVQPDQARGMVAALQARLQDTIATNSDVKEVQAQIRESEARLEFGVESAKTDVIKWFAAVTAAQALAITTAVVALVKLI